MPDVESFWHSLEEAYQAILSAPSFDAWIKTTRPLKLDNNQLWLEVRCRSDAPFCCCR